MDTIGAFDEENWDDDNSYFSFVDKIEELENGYHIIYFDSVLKSEITGDVDISRIKEESVKMIFANFNKKVFRDLLDKLKLKSIEEFEGIWFNLVITEKSNKYRVLVYPEYYNAETDPATPVRYIGESTDIISSSEIRKLKDLFDIPKSSPVSLLSVERWSKILSLDKIHCFNNQIHDVNVHNIGQGNLNTIVNDDNIPYFYFDIGGGAYRNAFTYPEPNPRKLCFKNTKLIILSHWDYDHWWTFNKLINEDLIDYPKIKWLVPSQPTGSISKRFYDKLVKKYKVIIWNNQKTELYVHPSVRVIKCNGTGNNKNNNGLAVIVEINNHNVLLPADASYEFIPWTKGLEFNGLVASHHGGKVSTTIDGYPKANENRGKIVYSCGAGNRYYHPSSKSISNHKALGWSMCKVTYCGSVSFLSNEPYGSPCEGDLGIEQVF